MRYVLENVFKQSNMEYISSFDALNKRFELYCSDELFTSIFHSFKVGIAKAISSFKRQKHIYIYEKYVINRFTSRPKCMPGSRDSGVTIVNPTEINVMYGYVT